MWRLVSLFIFLPVLTSFCQKMSVETGQIKFASHAELELIEATSDKVQGLLDTSASRFAFSVEIQSFKGFNSGLQREHFNEKYLESDLFPTATFSGKIIEQIDFEKEGTYEVRAKGELNIHGIKQTRIIKSKLSIADHKILITSEFTVPLADHNITIPQIVSQKIATEIEVSFKTTLVTK